MHTSDVVKLCWGDKGVQTQLASLCIFIFAFWQRSDRPFELVIVTPPSSDQEIAVISKHHRSVSSQLWGRRSKLQLTPNGFLSPTGPRAGSGQLSLQWGKDRRHNRGVLQSGATQPHQCGPDQCSRHPQTGQTQKGSEHVLYYQPSDGRFSPFRRFSFLLKRIYQTASVSIKLW